MQSNSQNCVRTWSAYNKAIYSSTHYPLGKWTRKKKQKKNPTLVLQFILEQGRTLVIPPTGAGCPPWRDENLLDLAAWKPGWGGHSNPKNPPPGNSWKIISLTAFCGITLKQMWVCLHGGRMNSCEQGLVEQITTYRPKIHLQQKTCVSGLISIPFSHWYWNQTWMLPI